jgi:MFS family permease
MHSLLLLRDSVSSSELWENSYHELAIERLIHSINSPASDRYEIPTKWQTALGVSTQIGNILGLQITGVASERFGYRITMLIALVCLTGFLFIQFFAANLGMLLAGYLLLGVSCYGLADLSELALIRPVDSSSPGVPSKP